MKRRLLRLCALFVAAAISSGAGCGDRESVDRETAEDPDQIAETLNSVTAESALLREMSTDIDDGATATDVAGNAATNVPGRFTPEGCVTSAAEGPVVTYTLDDCVGPHGLGTWKGDIEVTYARQTGGGITVSAASKDLMLNERDFDFNAASLYTIEGTSQQLAVTSQSSTTSATGRDISRNGDYSITWDDTSGCFGLDGSFATTVFSRSWQTTVSDYAKCPGECPADGGHIIFERQSETVTLTIDYDGDDTALYINNNGESGDIDVSCD